MVRWRDMLKSKSILKLCFLIFEREREKEREREWEREREQRQRQRQRTDRQIENKALLLMTFSIIMRHIFPKNFIKVPQVVRKIWRFSSSTLTILISFSFLLNFWHFGISLLQINLWHQHIISMLAFFTFNQV